MDQPEPWSWLAAAFGASFCVSLAITGILIGLAPRLGLVDLPSARKVHTKPTPKGGGLAILLAMMLLPLFQAGSWLVALVGLGAGIGAVGLIDDRRPLPWQFRLAVQSVAALLFLLLIEQSANSQALPLVWPVGWLWIVGLTNAFNMLDNMDGLSAGVAVIAAAFLTALAWLGHGFWSFPSAFPLVMLMGALAGFLWFNWPPARIFMGDVGSTFLGFFLASWSVVLGAETIREGSTTLSALLWILFVPIYDCTTVVLLRLSQGRSPFHADKQHLSHRLTNLGLGTRAAVRVIYGIGILSGFLGLLHLCLPVGLFPSASLLVVVWSGLAVLELYLKRLHHSPGVDQTPTVSFVETVPGNSTPERERP